jgi:hypothetical protein
MVERLRDLAYQHNPVRFQVLDLLIKSYHGNTSIAGKRVFDINFFIGIGKQRQLIHDPHKASIAHN